MSGRRCRIRLTMKAICAAKPTEREYPHRYSLLAHFGVRVEPSMASVGLVQTSGNGRMRKITLGCLPELFLNAARCCERREHYWKPSSLETFDIYMRNRLMPYFSRLRLDAINHAWVSAWFDATSVDWPVNAIRLLMLTGPPLSEMFDLKWGEIRELGEDGTSSRVEDTKTGPRTRRFGPEAAQVLAALSYIDGGRVFSGDLTSIRLYTFWVGVPDEAALPGIRVDDCRHTWAWQGMMNGVWLTTIGTLLCDGLCLPRVDDDEHSLTLHWSPPNCNGATGRATRKESQASS